MRTRLLGFLILFSTIGEAQQKILFVGNSLTYYNDLPEMVRRIARQDGVKVSVNSFLKANYSLEDHWAEGKVSAALRTTHYDFVVFQQGPSALKASRENLVEFAMLFSNVCRAQNTKIAFYSVWPSGDRAFDFDNVHQSYNLAADTTQGVFCPAGRAWLKTWEAKKDFPLYSSDGFHPTVHGSLLAALVIYGSLFEKDHFNFVRLDKLALKFVTPRDFDILKKAASEALAEK